MKIGITLEDDRGLESNVSLHFGQCKYFLIAEVENDVVTKTRVVENTAQHGGGGCVAVDEMLKYDINYVVAGGMGMGAQQKFAHAGIKVSGYQGKAKDAIEGVVKRTLDGLGSCKEHGECH